MSRSSKKKQLETIRGSRPNAHDLKKLAVTKLDAARRQLETAITLWFHDVDPVSVHTLTMAAHGILRALNKKRGGNPMLGDPAPNIRPEYHELVAEMFVESSNFFKHGGKDPLKTHYFAPQVNECTLLEACGAYESQAKEKRPLMQTFTLYLTVNQPRLFYKEYLESFHQNPLFPGMKALSKGQFFAAWLPAASAACALAAAGGAYDIGKNSA